MHIVYLTNEYPTQQAAHGGIGTFVQNIARNLVQQQIKVSVVGISLTVSKESLTNDKGVQVHRIPQSKAPFGKFIFNSFRIRKKLKEIHKQTPINIVEGSELSFAFLPQKTWYKKVIRMHGGHHFFAVTLNKKPALWRSFQEKVSFKKADALIAVSNFVGETTQHLLQFKKPYTTIYNFIDVSHFNKKCDVEIQPNAILFIGTICEKKGVKQLIEAFLLVKNNIPNATLHLVGRDWKSEEIPSYTSYIKKRIPKMYLQDVTFYGTVSYEQIPTLIAQSEVCVYPSHMESFGLTVIEAMATKKAIVFSDIPPFKEIIRDQKDGLACNPFKPSDIAEKIIFILTEKKHATAMAQSAFDAVHQKFNLENSLQENINFYNSIH